MPQGFFPIHTERMKLSNRVPFPPVLLRPFPLSRAVFACVCFYSLTSDLFLSPLPYIFFPIVFTSSSPRKLPRPCRLITHDYRDQQTPSPPVSFPPLAFSFFSSFGRHNPKRLFFSFPLSLEKMLGLEFEPPYPIFLSFAWYSVLPPDRGCLSSLTGTGVTPPLKITPILVLFLSLFPRLFHDRIHFFIGTSFSPSYVRIICLFDSGLIQIFFSPSVWFGTCLLRCIFS